MVLKGYNLITGLETTGDDIVRVTESILFAHFTEVLFPLHVMSCFKQWLRELKEL